MREIIFLRETQLSKLFNYFASDSKLFFKRYVTIKIG